MSILSGRRNMPFPKGMPVAWEGKVKHATSPAKHGQFPPKYAVSPVKHGLSPLSFIKIPLWSNALMGF